MSLLDQEIKYLAGVGPKKAEMLNKDLNIFTLGDLLYYFPYRYIDKSKFYSIREISLDLPYIQIKGEIKSFLLVGPKRGQRLIATFSDGTGNIELLWFKGIKWIQENLKPGINYTIFGKPTEFNGRINIVHPEVEETQKKSVELASVLHGMYNTSEKMKNAFLNSKAIYKLQQIAWQKASNSITETLPEWMINKLHFLPLAESIFNLHFPQNAEKLQRAEYRIKFEELFFIQLSMLRIKAERNRAFEGLRFPIVGNFFNDFYKNNLPFELTNAQKRVVKEIRVNMNSGTQMNRLVQGDVGSGKTLVALLSMLISLDNNCQSCLMAPTEILASQHFNSISQMLKGLDIQVGLLMGSTKKSEREKLLLDLVEGRLNILIGTHALLEDPVRFKHLGLVVIDEQHRFGVAQRAALWRKNDGIPPHVLVMTATPIPRTLAMTVYGDLDSSIIDELPPGRKPIITAHYRDSKRLRLFGFMKEQIKKGRQIYMVYPLINESEKMDYKNLEDGYFSIMSAFPSPEYYVALLHGKMKKDQKDISMALFKSGKAQIMVATTVIEVGVDVPNASVMVIESAERFGLSQLHQLRGRVGRGGYQSYCILMSGDKLSSDAKKRLEIMVETNDGFAIAEADMKLRGPGDIEGTQQSGMPFDLKLANIAKDGQLIHFSRDIATRLLDEDPELANPNNAFLKQQLDKKAKAKVNWGLIS